VIAVVAAAWADPPPFVQVDQADGYDGCVILIGQRDRATGIAPLRAVCDWPDVTVAQLHCILDRFDRYDAFIDCVDALKIVRTDEQGRTLVWQLAHLGWGLADRESQTWMKLVDDETGFEVDWETAHDWLPPQPGNLTAVHNNGGWWVSPGAGGGVHVVEDLDIDPGGTVPTVVINWFQTYALRAELRQLHALALTTTCS
jgi:hypothetical protein